MACPKCVRDPFAHSFTYFGKTREPEVSLYYTAPARVTARDDCDGTAVLQLHINEVKGKWIWVIDCANMELHNFYNSYFANDFQTILLKERSNGLQKVLILHPNVWVYKVLHRMPQDILDMIHVSANDANLNTILSDLRCDSLSKIWLRLAFVRGPNQILDAVKDS